MSLILAIIGLGVLIVVHEMGHMMVARWMGMRVEQFSVGFGPALLRWRGKSTTYQVALIPLGGYVKIAGMNPQENLADDDPGSYANKSPWARFATILAGPLTNYLFAMVIMSAVFAAWGLPNEVELTGAVQAVIKDKPAYQAGLQPGDTIVTIDGKAFANNNEARQLIQASKGRPLALTVKREKVAAPLPLTITPQKKRDRYLIGIKFDTKLTYTKLSLGKAVMLGVYFPVHKSGQMLRDMGKLFTGRVGVDQMGGPVAIVRQLKMSFDASLLRALIFLGLLNVLLGLFNLLPLPALDGGRLLFLLFTLITRRPVNQRLENAVHMVGFILLLSLLALVSFNDLGKLIRGQ